MSGGVPAGEGLRACPFCNAAAAVFWYDGFPQVRCDECGAATGMFTTGDERDAITAWNTRATPTPPIEGRDADVERDVRIILQAVADADSDWEVGSIDVDIPKAGYPRQWLRDAARAALQALGERG